MKHGSCFLRLAICLATSLWFGYAVAAAPAGYKLAWSDEFDGTALNTNHWRQHQPGKRHDAFNLWDAATVRDGLLTLATFTETGKHHTAMIDTHGRFQRRFGYWEARVRFDGTPGMWSAFWIHSPTMGRAVGDLAASGMEIDVVEHRVQDQKGKDISGKGQLTLHWDGYGKDHKSKGHLTDDLKLGEGFHTYGLEWTETEYRFFIDGQVAWTATPVSKRDQYIILSSEVRDNSWAGKIPPGGFGSRQASKTKMIVDYVRYYEKE